MSSIIVPGLKVSQLPIATELTPQDAFYVVDVETDTSRKTTFATISAELATTIGHIITSAHIYVMRSGDTMTGDLILDSDPTVPLQAATKQYVDSIVLSGDGVPVGVFLPVSGIGAGLAGTGMTGYLTLTADPTQPLHAVTKQYTYKFMPLSGGTMTNYLTLNADPVSNLHAATKQYVDSLVPNVTGGGGKFGKFVHSLSDSANTESGRYIVYFNDDANRLRVGGLFGTDIGFNGGQGDQAGYNHGVTIYDYTISSIDFHPYTNQHVISVVGLNHAQWALTNGGYVWGTGTNDDGILGINNRTTDPEFGNRHFPYWAQIYPSLFNNNPVRQLITSTGYPDGTRNNGSIFAITSANELFGWGHNHHGQLGLSNSINTGAAIHPTAHSVSGVPGSGNYEFRSPVQIAPTAGTGVNGSVNGKYIKFVASGGYSSQGQTFVIATDNTVHSTGWNSFGGLGLGDTTIRYRFNSVGMTGDAVFVGGGGTGSCTYILTGGQVWAAGINSYSQLGDGTSTQRNSFVRVLSGPGAPIGGVDRVILTADNEYYGSAFFLTTNKDLFACGYNGYGQLGTGDTATKSYATKVANNVDNVKCGGIQPQTVTAILCGGSIYTSGWHNGPHGLHGRGNLDIYPSTLSWARCIQPQNVKWTQFNMFNVGVADYRMATMMAIDQNQNIWTWGAYHYGLGGNGVFSSGAQYGWSAVPRRVFITP